MSHAGEPPTGYSTLLGGLRFQVGGTRIQRTWQQVLGSQVPASQLAVEKPGKCNEKPTIISGFRR